MMRSFSLFALLLAVALSVPTSAHAQEPTRADSARIRLAEPQDAEMRQQMQGMMPVMTDIVRQVTQSTIAALAEPQTAQNLARFAHNYYKALLAEGFTEEQAMRIVSNVGFPTVSGR